MPEASWNWLSVTVFIFALAASAAVVKNDIRTLSCYECSSLFGVDVKENERDRECEGLKLPQKYLHTGNISELEKNDSFVCNVKLLAYSLGRAEYEEYMRTYKKQTGPAVQNVKYNFIREIGFDSDYLGYPVLPSQATEKFLCYREGYERITDIPSAEYAHITCICTTNQCNGMLNVDEIMKKYMNATDRKNVIWDTPMLLEGYEQKNKKLN